MFNSEKLFSPDEQQIDFEEEENEKKKGYTIKDFTEQHEKDAKQLSEFLDTLPEAVKKILPPIEIRSSPREIHTEKEIEEFKKEKPNFNPDNSAGEYHNEKLYLYAIAFNQPTEVSEELRIGRIQEVLFHEFGHYAYEYFQKTGLVNEKEWDKVREADGNERNVSADYGYDLVNAHGFYHEITREEDFSDSFRYFLSNPIKFAKDFPNRHDFCRKLIDEIDKM